MADDSAESFPSPSRPDLDEFLEDVRIRQKNIVQGIGAWMFGLLYLLMGPVFIYMALQVTPAHGADEWFGVVAFAVLGVALVMLGIRTFRNGFPKHKSGTVLAY